MTFKYVAYNANGEVVKGKLATTSEENANELLDYVGYRIITLQPYVPFFSLDKLISNLFPVKPAEIILLYRQLAMLLESGTDISSSMDLLRQQTTTRSLRKVLGEILSDIRDGSPLSTALLKHPNIFPSTYSQLLGIGEQSGNLETVLRQVADYIEQEINTGKELKGVLTMPAITLVVAIVVIALMIIFILPSFGELYTSLGSELPTAAKTLIMIGEKTRKNGVYVLLGLAVIIGLVVSYIRTSRGRYQWDRLLLNLPLVGRVKHLTEIARYCRTMSLLFHAGLPLTEIMSLAIRSSSNKVTIESLTKVQEDMVKGEGLAGPMSKNKFFLPMLVQMVRVGEETGNLDVTLQAVAKSYEAEASDRIHSAVALITPALTLVIGGMVGGIAITLMSAMTSMYGEGF